MKKKISITYSIDGQNATVEAEIEWTSSANEMCKRVLSYVKRTFGPKAKLVDWDTFD